jgi:hypothetical protein
MAAGFDPYHRWLSIPPSEQPANHYRLLGVAAYEANVEVIQNAAERQSRHVRSHLRSPLGAHAINLIREIEVARLCLINADAKNAYDACLIQREALGSTRHQASASLQDIERRPVPWPSVEATAPAESPFSPSTFTPSIATGSKYRHSRRKSSPLAALLMWFASGSIGLLGGYAVLCLIDPQYDFLHVMFRDGRGDAARDDRVVASSTPNASEARPSAPRPVLNANVSRQPRRVAPAQASTSKGVEREPQELASLEDPLELVKAATDDVVKDENGVNHPNDALKPLVVPFDLKKRVIRVVSTLDEPPSQQLHCNIDGSPELRLSPLVDLPLGEKRELMFNLEMNDSIVGLEVSFVSRNTQVVVEIRPKYRLPSGDEESLYKLAGVRKAKVLTNQVAIAAAAQRSLPDLRTALSRTKADFDEASRIANASASPSRYAANIAARHRLPALLSQGQALERQLREAESLSARLTPLQVDLSAIQELGQWGAKISESATLSVCIHRDGESMFAEAK